jgi:ceramide glucosyltransferase
MIDSDIEVDLDHLKKLGAELQKPGVGAVTCLYRGMAGEGIWARLATMRINAEFLPNVIVALTTQLAHPCFGASIAIKRETLRRIGGLAAFADQLWDDYAIGEAVRNLGHEVVVAPFAVGHLYKTSTARTWFADELRAVCTIRDIDPIGHAGSLITHPMPLALIAMLLGGGERAITLALVAIVCRMALARITCNRFDADTGIILLLPLRELISFLVYVASFFGSTVTWRGRRYQILERMFIADPR